MTQQPHEVISVPALFALQEAVIEFRGVAFRVREITHAERIAIVKQMREADDATLGPALFAAAGCIEPTLTADQAANTSAQLIELLARKVMQLSGMRAGDDAGKD